MRWERDRSGALIPRAERAEHVVPPWALAGLAEMLRFGDTVDELRPYGLVPPIQGGAPDAHANFAYSTVATAPSPANSGASVIVQAGDGALFPTVPFNAVACPTGVRPTKQNAEIVRCTARPGSADTFTITRAQEGTTARSILVGDQFFNAPTAKAFTDIEQGIARGSSSVTFSASASSATTVVNHGLSDTPASVVVSYAVAAGAWINAFSKTSTQFTIQGFTTGSFTGTLAVDWIAAL